MREQMRITRGQIFYATMPLQLTDEDHSVQAGHRPVVVVSSPVGIRTSSIVMVCPLTTKCKNLSCNVDISWTDDGRRSQVLCNQLMTIPKDTLEPVYDDVCKFAHLDREEQRNVDIAMLISLGIKVNFKEVKYYDEKITH